MEQKGRLVSLAMHGRSDSSQPLLPSPATDDGWPSSLQSPKSAAKSSRRRVFGIIAAFLSVVSIGALAFSYSSTFQQKVQVVADACLSAANTSLVPEEQYVLGPPTDRFRNNLRNDTKYITSWVSAGWTNDV
jgi:hypothetical protein